MLRPCLGSLSRPCPTHALVAAPLSRCADCRHAQDAARGSTLDRGYGAEHEQLRASVAAAMARGVVYSCARCHEPIHPDPTRVGDGWQLDHDDHDRSRYIGPSHDRCNSSAGGRKRGQG